MSIRSKMSDCRAFKARVGIVVWTIDPENNIRYLLRHNSPFDGHPDEWNVFYGTVESDESPRAAALRELEEESGLHVSQNHLIDIESTLTYSTDAYDASIKYFSVRLESVHQKIVLNDESIGYNWVTLPELVATIPCQEQVEIFTKVHEYCSTLN